MLKLEFEIETPVNSHYKYQNDQSGNSTDKLYKNQTADIQLIPNQISNHENTSHIFQNSITTATPKKETNWT